MNKTFRNIMALVLISTVITSSSYAGWVDDWVQQKTESSPGYFKGQKRGFVSGGGFSARWQTGTDSPFAVEAPRFKVGCGGIDLSAGSMSYLDFNHLTAKMRKILANAPAAAFDMALQTLCQPCVQTIKSMSALADQFNSMQINDCQASKALVATITDGKLSSNDQQAQGGLTALNTAVTGGASSWWGGVKETAGTFGGDFSTMVGYNKSNTTAPADADPSVANPLTTSCPAQLQPFLPDNDGERISMLDEVGVNQRGLSQDTIDAFRGLVGDIEFRNNKMKIEVRTILPCSGQTATDTNIFLGGTPALRKEFDVNQGGILPCTAMPDTNANLTTYVTKKMQSIADKMANKSTSFTASDQAFLDSNPMGLSMTLRTAIGTSTEDSTIANMSGITAKAYAYYMMSDLYSVGLSTVFALSQAMDSGMVHKEGCDLSTLEPNTKTELATFIKKIDTMKSQSMVSYQASINEQQAVQAYLKSVSDMQNQLYDRIAKDFGASVAGRIAKR